MYHLAVPTIGLGSTDTYQQVGNISVSSITGTGTSASSINAVTKRIGLLNTNGDILQSGAINVRDLGIETTGNVTLTNAGNAISNLAVAQTGSDNNIDFTNGNTVSIAKLQGGTVTATQLYSIDGVHSDGNVTMNVNGAIIKGTGTVTGGSIRRQLADAGHHRGSARPSASRW
jgi:hypothetical protein